MREMRGDWRSRDPRGTGKWLAVPVTPAEAELRQALDHAASRAADEVALRRVWARLSELPASMPLVHDGDSDGQDRDYQHQLDELRSRRVRWPWIVAASLAGATATLAFMLFETKSEFRAGRQAVVAKTTDVNGTSVGGSDAGQRSVLVAPATVRTGFGETLHLSLRGGTEVVVTSESTLVLDQNDRPAVSSGEVQFRVPHQAAGQTFSVGAGAYRVVVVGTRFRVRVSQSSAAVGVEEGVVEVWTDHRIARVAAGESWVSPGATQSEGNKAVGGVGTGPGATAPIPARTEVAPTKSVPSGVKAASSSSTKREKVSGPGVGKPSASKAAVSGSRSHGTNGRMNLALASPSSSSTSSTAPVMAGPYNEPATSSQGGRETAVVTAAPTTQPATESAAIASPPAPIPSDIAALTLQARAARTAGDVRKALGIYRTLAQKGGPTGENAEYEIGRVLRDGLHQPREAVAAWRAYRAQHPRGLLRVEADLSVIETLVSLGDKTGAGAEASDFIRRYPDSERRAEIARLAGDLQRERGQCAEAVRSYGTALSSAHSRRDVADSATFHRSVCLLQADRGEGSAALRSYLDSFPGGRYRLEAQRLLTTTSSAGRATTRTR